MHNILSVVIQLYQNSFALQTTNPKSRIFGAKFTFSNLVWNHCILHVNLLVHLWKSTETPNTCGTFALWSYNFIQIVFTTLKTNPKPRIFETKITPSEPTFFKNIFIIYKIIVFCNSVVEMNSSCIDATNKPNFVQCL